MQFSYTIDEVDAVNKRLRVTFDNGEWAMIPLPIPLPDTKEKIDEVVKQWTDSEVRLTVGNVPTDMSFLEGLVGQSLIAERLRVKHNEIDPNTVEAPPTLEQRQQVKWREIQAERERRKYSGGVKVGTQWFYTDADTRSQFSILDSMAIRKQLADNFVLDEKWKTMSPLSAPVYVPMTVGLMRQIIDAATAMEKVNYSNGERHRGLMLQAVDPDSYVFSDGWHETYVW